jgi:hypothetical protein
VGISRRTALNRIAGLSACVEGHLAKMRTEPLSIDYNHWQREVREWIAQIELAARHVGRRTQSEVMIRVSQWKQDLPDEAE